MRNAVDFSFARPSVDEVVAHGVDILIYTGSALPSADYVAAMRAAGVAVTLIQETVSDRSQSGYGAGVQDANYANARANSVGYPVTCAICYVVSDGNASDPNSGGDNIAAYAKGIQDTSSRPFFFYGNRYAADAAMRGAPNGLGCWVPSTWGAKPTDLLIQEANFASPIADSDLNTVHASYGAWGQDTPTPTPIPLRSDVIYKEENGQYWEMGLGDYVLLPTAVGVGAALNGAVIVPIKTGERIQMGLAAKAQAKKFLKDIGLVT